MLFLAVSWEVHLGVVFDCALQMFGRLSVQWLISEHLGANSVDHGPAWMIAERGTSARFCRVPCGYCTLIRLLRHKFRFRVGNLRCDWSRYWLCCWQGTRQILRGDIIRWLGLNFTPLLLLQKCQQIFGDVAGFRWDCYQVQLFLS